MFFWLVAAQHIWRFGKIHLAAAAHSVVDDYIDWKLLFFWIATISIVGYKCLFAQTHNI